MKCNSSRGFSGSWLWLAFAGLGLFLTFLTPTASAIPGRIIFSVNGDSTLTTEVQGDTVYWGSTCLVGDSMTWYIWHDVNADGVLDDPGDKLILQYTATDGDTSSNKGPADISATPDGLYQIPPMILGIAPVHYIFVVESMTSHAKLQKAVACTALPSPTNSFSGTVTVPGHSAPDALLEGLWIEAGGESVGDQIWSAFTDSTGAFTINIGSQGTDQTFRLQPPDLPGFVTPERVYDTASGHKSGRVFAYGTPSDSLYGRIVDDRDSLIKIGLSVYCMPNGGGSQKSIDVTTGIYSVPFTLAELGEWFAGVSNDQLEPNYMTPQSFFFDNSIQHGINHDFVCPRADTVLYAKITENGNHPTHRYHLQAIHDSLGFQTQGISDTGSLNVMTIHISKHYTNDWSVSVISWDTLYPIPAGYILGSTPNHLSPGDTATINLVNGKKVSDTLQLDMNDEIPTLDSVWVTLWSSGQNYGAHPDNQGIFTIYGDTGVYSLGASCPGYLVLPSTPISLHLLNDTVGGLKFSFNQLTCKVTGTLTNVPLPLTGTHQVYAHTGIGPSAYNVWANVNNTDGTYTMWLCDGSWTVDPPTIANRVAPSAASLTIGNAPDSTRTTDFAFSSISDVNDNDKGLPKSFALLQNHPNPFNPSTQISYDLPTAGHVDLTVYDVLGRIVTVLVDADRSAGRYSATWDGTDAHGQSVASGIYFYRIRSGSFTQAKKMILLK